jgi:Xaa-Pro dipeptidase
MDPEAWNRLRRFMEEMGFGRFFVARPENFAWLLGGENTLGMGEGVAYLEVGEEVVVHTTRVEHPRIAEEEAPGLPVQVHPWYAFPPPPSPSDLEHDLTPLRLVLSSRGQEAFRRLGREAAGAVGEVVRQARTDWTEYELAGALAEALWGRGTPPPSPFGGGGGEALPAPPSPAQGPAPGAGPHGGGLRLPAAGLVANLTRMVASGPPRGGGPLPPKVLGGGAA